MRKHIGKAVIPGLILLVFFLVSAIIWVGRPALAQGTSSVTRKAVPQQSWATGVSAVLTPTMAVRGKVEQIVVEISDATNGITFTLTITNSNGGTLYTQAGIAENAVTVYKATSDSTDFNAFLGDEICTFTLTPSGDPGASGVTVDAVMYMSN